jgi:hypothetical protein
VKWKLLTQNNIQTHITVKSGGPSGRHTFNTNEHHTETVIMPLDKPDIVDAVGIEKGSDFVALTIADSWDWREEQAHLLALQAKLNAYFSFVESGQIWDSYPDAVGRQVVIDVIGKFPLPQCEIDLLTRASDACAALGIRIRYRHYPGPEQVQPGPS